MHRATDIRWREKNRFIAPSENTHAFVMVSLPAQWHVASAACGSDTFDVTSHRVSCSYACDMRSAYPSRFSDVLLTFFDFHQNKNKNRTIRTLCFWNRWFKMFSVSVWVQCGLFLVFLAAFAIMSAGKTYDVVFSFPEYDYKESPKNVSLNYRFFVSDKNSGIARIWCINGSIFLQELTFREYESACDQSSRCERLTSIARMKCVRECISPSCYREIYEFDDVSDSRFMYEKS